MSDSRLAICSASLSDAAAICDLIQRAVRVSNAPDYPLEIIEIICAEFTLAKITADMARRDVFVALEDGAIVGTVSLGGGKLHSLFVEPDQQGTGVGSALVAVLEQHAQSVGLATLRLSSSLTARRFYAGRGYRELAIERHRDFTTVLMEKALGRTGPELT